MEASRSGGSSQFSAARSAATWKTRRLGDGGEPWLERTGRAPDIRYNFPKVDDLKVLIVADDPLARAGLAAVLTHGTGVTVVGQIERKSATPSALDVFRPTVVVWDLGWESDSASTEGLEYLSALSDGAIPVVALVSDQRQAVGAWLAGSRGLLLRASPGANLRAAVRAVSQGLMALDPELSPALLPSVERSGEKPAGPNFNEPITRELTPRETQVLQLLAEGLPNKVIAARLDISEHTVKFHINSIMGKLGAQSRTDAVMRATRSGLILL